MKKGFKPPYQSSRGKASKPKRKFSDKEVFKKNRFRSKSSAQAQAVDFQFPARLNKYLAHAGIASRREADELIQEGLVSVNGQVVREMGHKVQEKDVVKFKGNIIRPEKKVYILLNKPKDYITTTDDERNRKTVMELIRNATQLRVYPVGRLDRHTTGLLLLTNDGELTQRLSHPKYEVKKVYHVTLDKPLAQPDIEKIAEGITLEEGIARVDSIAYADPRDKKHIGIELHIGWNKVVRRIFEHLGYEVKNLDRVYYGGLTKKILPRGKWRYLSEREVVMLRNFGGPKAVRRQTTDNGR